MTVPCHKGLEMNNSTFTLACRLRLGLPLPSALTAEQCICGTTIDPFGDHLLCCRHGGERHFRHDCLVEAFRVILREVKLPANSEVLLSHLHIRPAGVDADQKRADLYWVEDGVGHFGDVTVVHPTQADPSFAAHRTINRANGR